MLNLSSVQAKAKDARLRRDYGLNLEEFTAILASQGWRCPICNVGYQDGKLWCVDHEHRNGLEGPIRGILCFRCNRYKVGALKLVEAERIFSYLTHPPAYPILGGERIANPKKNKKKKRIRSRGSNAANAGSSGTLRRERKPVS
jgi:hypothetical protein